MKTKMISKKSVFLTGLLIVLLSFNQYAFAGLPGSPVDGGEDGPTLAIELLKNRETADLEATSYVQGEVLVKFKEGVSPEAVLQEVDIAAGTIERIHSIQPAIAKFKKDLKLEKDSDGWYWFRGRSYEGVGEICDEEIFEEACANISPIEKSLYQAYKIELTGGITVKDAVRELEKNPAIEYAEPNYIIKVQMVPNDPYYQSSGSWGQNHDDLWGLKEDRLECEPAWDISQGENVVVAVIDTGVDYTHPDLEDNIWINKGEIPDNGIDDDGNGYIDDVRGWNFSYNYGNDPRDDNGHGTHCAGTIAAIGNDGIGVIGVAPKTKIMPVKGFGADGSSRTTTLVACIKYAANNGADILSNSWSGFGISRTLENVFNYAYEEKRCVSIGAAGNDNIDVRFCYPANIDTVIAVAATAPDDKKCDFSNYGFQVDVAAPGESILSTYPTNLSNTPSEAIVTVNSADGKSLQAYIMVYSAELPEQCLQGQTLYANLGHPEDFEGQDFTGKIALMKRGAPKGPDELYYRDMVINAHNVGAIGAIIYNKVEGGQNIRGTLQTLSNIPAVSLSNEDGVYVNNLIDSTATTVTLSSISLGDYTVYRGTSMACPHVAGVAALLKHAYPEDSPDTLRARIMAGAENINSLNPGYAGRLGTGRVNAHNSLTLESKPLLKIMNIEKHEFAPGREGALIIHLKNFWQDAGGVLMTLTTDHPLVTIQNSAISLGDIPSGQTVANSESPFIIYFNENISYDDAVGFNLILNVQGGHETRISFTVSFTFFEDVGANTGLPLVDYFPLAVLMEDYNNDAYPDAVFFGFSEFGFYKNCGDGSFVEYSEEAGVNGGAVHWTAVFMDINNDGNQDMVVGSGHNSLNDNKLFLNNGDGTFEDISEGSGLRNGIPRLAGIVPIDYNNDGLLDMFGDGGMMENNGDNTFSRVNTGLTGAQIPFVRPFACFDYDNDGDQDVIQSHTSFCRNNGDGTFTEVSENSFTLPDNITIPDVCAIAAGDYNNDGYTDMFLSYFINSQNEICGLLFKNNGDGTFSDVTQETGSVGFGSAGMLGTDFFDYDNDGDLDLYMTDQIYYSGHMPRNELYKNNGDGTFTRITDIAFSGEVVPSFSPACMGDYNDDGAIDIYAPASSMFTSAGAFLENVAGTVNNWIKIELVGTISTRDAHGARVHVKTGGLTQYREVHTAAVQTQPLHFGLGKESAVEEIEIRWPSGIIEKFYSLEANQTLTFVEPATSGLPRIRSLEPSLIPIGGSVTITGQNLGSEQGAGSVLFHDGIPAGIVSWSDTEIVCTIPEGATSGNVHALTDNGKSNGIYYAILTIPAMPSEFRIEGQKLLWRDNADNEQGFIIERSEDNVEFSTLTTSGRMARQYTVKENDKDYYYRICSYNSLGESDRTNSVSIPAKPTNLTAVVVSSSEVGLTWEVDLTWKDNSGVETEYRIEQWGLSGYYPIAFLPSDTTSFRVTGLIMNNTYYFKVKACSAWGSATISDNVRIGRYLPGDYPKNLQATAISSTQVDLSWTGASGYYKRIERSSDGVAFTEIDTVYYSAYNYSDTGLESGTTYFYRMCAYNAVGNSEYSNIAEAATLVPPAAPSGLAAEALSLNEVGLTWQDNSDNEIGFKIERSLTFDDGYAEIASVDANTTTYGDTEDLNPGTTYYYRILAYNDDGNSGYSNTAEVTTPMPPPVIELIYPAKGQVGQFVTIAGNNFGDCQDERSGRVIFHDEVEASTIREWSDNRIGCYVPEGAQKGNVYVETEGGMSNGVYFDVLYPPAEPSDLAANAPLKNMVKLNWRDNSDNEKELIIERVASLKPMPPPSPKPLSTEEMDGEVIPRPSWFVEIARVDADTTEFVDTSVNPETKYLYRVRAYNEDGYSGYSNVTEVTTPANQPPILKDIGNKTVNEGETLVFTVSATDPDDVKLFFKAYPIPDGARFVIRDDKTRVFIWAPRYDQAGTYEITFSVSDGDLIGTETITITVNNVTPAQLTAKLINFIKSLDLHKGTKKSLVKKLENVIKSLEKGKPGAAINKLNSFINEVEAQTGKKIPEKVAYVLIKEAKLIIYLIGEGV